MVHDVLCMFPLEDVFSYLKKGDITFELLFPNPSGIDLIQQLKNNGPQLWMKIAYFLKIVFDENLFFNCLWTSMVSFSFSPVFCHIHISFGAKWISWTGAARAKAPLVEKNRHRIFEAGQPRPLSYGRDFNGWNQSVTGKSNLFLIIFSSVLWAAQFYSAAQRPLCRGDAWRGERRSHPVWESALSAAAKSAQPAMQEKQRHPRKLT